MKPEECHRTSCSQAAIASLLVALTGVMALPTFSSASAPSLSASAPYGLRLPDLATPERLSLVYTNAEACLAEADVEVGCVGSWLLALMLAQHSGQFAFAEYLSRGCVRAASRVRGSQTALLATCQVALGDSLAAQGMLAEAEEAYLAAIDALAATLNRTSGTMRALRRKLADVRRRRDTAEQ